jgi:predicted HicB family RNase H-like nuclease
MKDVLTYKGFIGSVHFSNSDKVFHGKLEGINDLITFEGRNVSELTTAFRGAVNDYLELCKEAGKNPERSYKGSFNVRIPA